MIQNKRPMGEGAGYFIGPEVERSQFHGLETIFFSRFKTLQNELYRVMLFPHVFIALVNPKFWQDSYQIENELIAIIYTARSLLENGKKVTIEVDASQSTRFVDLRTEYPETFCLMIVVEVPKLQAGGFCIKAAPTHVFEDIDSEQCVLTASFAKLKEGASFWPEYNVDTDGEKV